MTIRLSPTKLNIFIDCPRCFWLAINKGLKRPSAPFPSLPSGMDKIVKTHFDKYRETEKLPPELAKESIKARLLSDLEKMAQWRNNFKGITYKKGNTILRGAIDELLVKNEKIIVLDFKTRGYPPKEETHEYYQEQLDIYNFLLNKNDYLTHDYAYLLYYYPQQVNKDGTITFNTELVKMDINLHNAQTIFNNAIKCLQGAMPQINEECEWCQFSTGENKDLRNF